MSVPPIAAPVAASVLDLTTRPGETDRAGLERLAHRFRAPGGLWGWIIAVDHRSIARRYLTTAFAWFLLAVLNAGLMRLQLSRPDNGFLGPDRYNQIFTVHETVMMFLFAVPIMTAFAIYLVPLMLGTRDVAFPRLNAFGYWVFLNGGLVAERLGRWHFALFFAGVDVTFFPMQLLGLPGIATGGSSSSPWRWTRCPTAGTTCPPNRRGRWRWPWR